MSSRERQEVLRSTILRYLRHHGRAAGTAIAAAIGAPREDTVKKALDYLATTQQIYVDVAAGSRDPTYFTNGKLAHDKAQTIVECGNHQYVIRAWDDRLAGKTLTITQYVLSPSQDPKPHSGIRVDWEDAEALIAGISEILDSVRRPAAVQTEVRGDHRRLR